MRLATSLMAFILIPKNGEDVTINGWNWRPTLELLHNAKLIDDDLFERMGTSCLRTIVDGDTTVRIADFLNERLLTMKAGDRIRADSTKTKEPKKSLIFTPGMPTDQIDAADAYSAT